jgi:hypothetical protein
MKALSFVVLFSFVNRVIHYQVEKSDTLTDEGSNLFLFHVKSAFWDRETTVRIQGFYR